MTLGSPFPIVPKLNFYFSKLEVKKAKFNFPFLVISTAAAITLNSPVFGKSKICKKNKFFKSFSLMFLKIKGLAPPEISACGPHYYSGYSRRASDKAYI